jgi:hypothetical protein
VFLHLAQVLLRTGSWFVDPMPWCWPGRKVALR